MKRILICSFILLLVMGIVSADAFATIAMKGLSFVDPKIAQTVNLAVCAQNFATCAEGMVTSQIQGQAISALTKAVPETAKVINVYNQVQELKSLGAEITRDLSVNQEGGIEKGTIIFNNKEDSNVGNFIGKNLNKEDITARGVELNKEKNFSLFVFKDENSKVCVKSNCFENIEPKPDGPPSTIKLDEKGDILIADFKTNEKGGIYTVNGSTFEAPPNSRVYYNREEGSRPNVKLEENSNINPLSNSKGEVTYEGENFKMGDSEIKGLNGNSGKISFSDGKITKVWENTETTVDGIQHKTLRSSLNLYYDKSFDASNHLEENYFNYGENKISLGGKGFVSTLEENNKIFTSMKDSGKGNIMLFPEEGQIELTENSEKSGFNIKSEGNFRLVNKGIQLISSPDDLKMLYSYSEKGYDFNLDGEFSLKDGILNSIENPNLKVSTNDLAYSTISKIKNLDKDELDKLVKTTQDRFGTKPDLKKYLDPLANSKQNEKYLKLIYDATKKVNEINDKVTINAIELAIIATAEGGPKVITKNLDAPVNGFTSFGTNVIGAEMPKLIDGGFIDPNIEYKSIMMVDNKGNSVKSAIFPDMKTGLEALAGVYADRKYSFEKDFKKNFGEDEFNTLTNEEKYFWTNVYYTQGVYGGKAFLTGKRGPGREEYYTLKGVNSATPKGRTVAYSFMEESCIFEGSCS